MKRKPKKYATPITPAYARKLLARGSEVLTAKSADWPDEVVKLKMKHLQLIRAIRDVS